LKGLNNLESLAVQKMVDIIVKYTFSDQLTLKKVSSYTNIIIENLYGISSNEIGSKSRSKKAVKCDLKYDLSNGRKISLPWYLIFKLLQKQL